MEEGAMWATAARRAASLAPPGPVGSEPELQALVRELHSSAARAPMFVGRITGLKDAAEAAGEIPVHVVDRPRWAKANATLMQGLTEQLPASSGRINTRIQAEETGAILAYLSTKVLGQFDPYTDDGRLLLVAPNVLRLERELDLDARDFRLWVCLHEITHAVQFAAAPWLADHLRASLEDAVTSVADDDSIIARFSRAINYARRSGKDREGRLDIAGPMVDAILSDEERAKLARIVAVMSLLEGHADVVMDAVGPAVLPSVRRIRSTFEKRRDGGGLPDIVARSLLGISAKTAQYRNGAKFVKTVVKQLGHRGLDPAWQDPHNLPSPEEIMKPAEWIARIHRTVTVEPH